MGRHREGFILIPPDPRIADAHRDYKKIKPMIFGAYLSWEEITHALTAIESRANDIRSV